MAVPDAKEQRTHLSQHFRCHLCPWFIWSVKLNEKTHPRLRQRKHTTDRQDIAAIGFSVLLGLTPWYSVIFWHRCRKATKLCDREGKQHHAYSFPLDVAVVD